MNKHHLIVFQILSPSESLSFQISDPVLVLPPLKYMSAIPPNQIDSDKNGLTTQKICRTLLGQKNYKANVWIICLAGTQDEVWLEEALKSFDKEKIEFINFKDLQL